MTLNGAVVVQVNRPVVLSFTESGRFRGNLVKLHELGYGIPYFFFTLWVIPYRVLYCVAQIWRFSYFPETVLPVCIQIEILCISTSKLC